VGEGLPAGNGIGRDWVTGWRKRLFFFFSFAVSLARGEMGPCEAVMFCGGYRPVLVPV